MNNELLKELEFRGCNEMPKVLLAAAECAPLAKTGGLADVVGTLPKSLSRLGIEARIIIPYHRIIKEKYGTQVEHMLHFYSNLGWRHEYVGLEKLVINGVTIYLIDSERYFGDKIYRGGNAEGEQYSYFCRAVLDTIPCLDFKPDIIHCNDWHTAMLPMLARTQYCGGMQEKLKFLITIHNIAFQGKYSFDFVSDQLGVDSRYYTPEFMELNGCADYLKAGCVFSDRINTVSPSYAEEIKTSYYGEGLEGILNARSAQLSGIINGIDVDVFNPSNDRLLPASYESDAREGKTICKAELQKKAGLEQRDDVPLFAMVTRMTEQKGFDLVSCVIDELMSNNDMQFILLGSGDERFENFMRGAEQRWKGRLSAYIGYSEEYSHLVYAGADFYLMPSRFEPCGLSQMIAMRYGTIPIVRETGGLKDTVDSYNKYAGTGTGFSFANYDAWEMRDTVLRAIQCYSNSEIMDGLIRSAMGTDFSFDRSAFEYAKLYIEMYGECFKKPLILEHNAASTEFRNPCGALKCGGKTELSFKLISGNIKDPVLVLFDDRSRLELPMNSDGDRYSIELNAPYYPSALNYVFRFDTAYGTRWLCRDVSGYRSRVTDFEAEGFRLTVYNADFTTPSWFRKSVLYQIFPDSFSRSNDLTAQKGIAKHNQLGQKSKLRLQDVNSTTEDEIESDCLYYGGTFKGIEEKLSYLYNLGVSAIYLNPIFQSATRNRFDVSDYSKPDPVLGSMADFKRLCNKARKLGIRVILDGVFSHTGSDSVYFNSSGSFGNGGACSGPTSKYYEWYSFNQFPNSYKCWWGIDMYPDVDTTNISWQEFIADGDESVIKTWTKQGASGWRINVADEIPDSVLQVLYDSIKSVCPDAPVIGEVWDDPVTKFSNGAKRNYALGTCCDSFMNYPLRSALIDFILGRTDAAGLKDFLINQKLNYPAPIYYSMMNLLGSHDVDRIRTALCPPDIPSFSAEAMKEAWTSEKLCAFLQFVLPGVPSVYYGDEQGMMGTGIKECRELFTEARSDEFIEYYKSLIALRNTRPELSTGNIEVFHFNKDVIAVLRYTCNGRDIFGEPSVDSASISIVNRGNEDCEYSIDLSIFGYKSLNGSISARSTSFMSL